MGNDEHAHLALPKLYGAPAYARPATVPVQRAERPFDPDDLPLVAELTSEEREIISRLASLPNGEAAAPESSPPPAREGSGHLLGRPFQLRALGTRLKGDPNRAAGSEDADQPAPAPAAEADAGTGDVDESTPAPEATLGE